MQKINSLLLGALITHLTSCGSTKVSVDRPAVGTSTTITVTTNNPITTEINTDLKNNVELNKN